MRSEISMVDERSSQVAYDLSKDWQRWCRLCAKDDMKNVNIFLKDEDMIPTAETIKPSELGLPIAISTYFNVEMNPDEQLPIQLCTHCFLLITSLIKFNERVIKVQQMYLALRHNNTVTDLPAFRLKFGVFENEQPHQFMYQSHNEIQLFEEKLKTHEHGTKAFVEEANAELLQESRTALNIKSENADDMAPLNDEDVCVFDYEDPEGEDPFGSDVEVNNEDGEKVCWNTQTSSKQLKKSEEAENETTTTPSNIKYEKYTPSSKDGFNNVSTNLANKEAVVSADVDADEKEKPYTCVECSKVFKRLSNYRSHMERKHAKTDAVPHFPCTKCTASFNTSAQLNHHHTIKHLPIAERRIIPCPYCEQKFPTKHYVATHIKYVHLNERSFICEECGEAVRSKGQLKQHMLTHTDYAPFECEVCKKCFKNQERLKNHMETHNPNKHICAKCGLQLNSRITLNRHLLVHSDVMQHKCDYCGRAFKRAKALKNHLILHTGLKPYSCDFCDRTFANGSNCRTHKRKAHPDELAAQEATGGKSYTKNIPKLAVLKSVTQAAENLAPVVSKLSGNFAFGKKPTIPLDSVGTISKRQRKLYDESILASTSRTSNESIDNCNNQQSIQPLLHHKGDLQLNSINKNDNSNIDCQNIPTIDNIYSHLLMKQNANFGMTPASEISPLHLDIKHSRSEVPSPAGNNSSISVDVVNAIAQQQQLSQHVIASPQQEPTVSPNEVQSFYRC